ncbi:bacteriocin immunity protein [Lactobacillus sp. AN1001]
MNEVYNFILDSNITEEERRVFIDFKNNMGMKNDFSNSLMSLSYDLRQIALKNVSKHVSLTPKVSEFYNKIVSYGQLKLNWARGLASYGMFF